MSEVPSVSVSQVPDDAVILDVREPEEWSLGHAPGAVHIPLGDLPSRLADLPDTDAAPLAVACRVGVRSARAVAWLARQGFEVVNLDGGMKAWQSAGKALTNEGGAAPTVR